MEGREREKRNRRAGTGRKEGCTGFSLLLSLWTECHLRVRSQSRGSLLGLSLLGGLMLELRTLLLRSPLYLSHRNCPFFQTYSLHFAEKAQYVCSEAEGFGCCVLSCFWGQPVMTASHPQGFASVLCAKAYALME